MPGTPMSATITSGAHLPCIMWRAAAPDRLTLVRSRAGFLFSTSSRLGHQFTGDLCQEVVGDLFLRERLAQ